MERAPKGKAIVFQSQQFSEPFAVRFGGFACLMLEKRSKNIFPKWWNLSHVTMKLTQENLILNHHHTPSLDVPGS